MPMAAETIRVESNGDSHGLDEAKVPQKKKKERKRISSLYADNVEKLHKGLCRFLLKPIMFWSASHPYACILIGFVLSLGVAGLSIGTGSITTENDTRRNAVSQKSYTIRQFDFVQTAFPIDRTITLLFHNRGDNILTHKDMTQLWDIVEMIPTLEYYNRSCHFDPALPCQFFAATSFWNNRQQFDQIELSIPSTTNNMSNATTTREQLLNQAVRNVLSRPTLANGLKVNPSDLFGRFQTTTTTTNQTKILSFAQSTRLLLTLPNIPIQPDSNRDQDKTTQVHHRPFTRELARLIESLQNSNIHVEIFTEQVLSDELDETVEGDLPLVYAALGIMAIYTSIVMTRCARRRAGGGGFCIQSHGLLGFGAVVTVLLSMALGYGICTLAGYPITQLTQVLPFVLIGVGLDDSFILMGSFYSYENDHNNNNNTEEETFHVRLSKTLFEAGTSVTVTSLTDMLAFALGGIFSSIPGIRWFCLFAVVSILMDYLLQITVFVAFLALDYRRIQANRLDYFICFKVKTRDDPEQPANNQNNMDELDDDEDEEDDDESSYDVKKEVQEGGPTKEEEAATTKRSFVNSYTKLLLHPISKVVVLVSFTALLIFGAISASSITVRTVVTDWTFDDALVDRFFEAGRNYFADLGGSLPAFVYFHQLNVSDPQVQSQMQSFLIDLEDLGYFDTPRENWLFDFQDFENKTYSNTTVSFEEKLDTFLSTEQYRRYSRHIIRDPETGQVVTSRVDMNLAIDVIDTKTQVELLIHQRQVTLQQPLNQEDLTSDGVDHMFLLGDEFSLYEHFRVIPRELVTSLCLSALAVAIISLLFFSHLTGTILSVLVIVAVDVELVGVIPAAGLHLNSITVLLLIMAIGLVVDYCLHVIHAYLQQTTGTRNERVTKMLQEIGSSVFFGGFSTFLGVLALAFSSSAVFRTFFTMFSSMVVFGLGHGLVFIPVVLSLVGPTISHNDCGESKTRNNCEMHDETEGLEQ